MTADEEQPHPSALVMYTDGVADTYSGLDVEKSIDLLQIIINRDPERVMLRACRATMRSMLSDHEKRGVAGWSTAGS